MAFLRGHGTYAKEESFVLSSLVWESFGLSDGLWEGSVYITKGESRGG